MEQAKTVVISLRGCMSDTGAQAAAARVRAAMNNGVRRIVLDCAPDFELASGELLGFLAVGAERAGGESGNGIIWRNAPTHLRQLLAALRLDCLFCYEDAIAPVVPAPLPAPELAPVSSSLPPSSESNIVQESAPVRRLVKDRKNGKK